MAPPQDFIDYPRPEEGPKVEYTVNAQQNPVLRGLPLLIASHLYAQISLAAHSLAPLTGS